MNKPVIEDDGVTHINIYSRGATPVGRALSNFTLAPFEHPEFGRFVSVEGFWYWLSAGANPEHDRMRRLYGPSAKFEGARLLSIPQDDEYFHEQICRAIECKVRQNPDILKEVVASSLPFMHYIVMHEKDYREQGQYRRWPVLKQKHQWQVDFLEDLRRRLKDESTQQAPDAQGSHHWRNS